MSKIKFGLGALQAAQENYQIILDRLIRGYQKMMKKDPEGLDLIKIKQEARQRADESAKVVDMEGKTLNPDKPIMGGTQQIDEAPKSKVMEAAESFFGPIGKKDDFGEGIKKIYDEAKGPGKGDEMVEALKSPGAIKSSEIIEAQLKETFPDIKLFGDETFEEILEIQRTGKHPRMKADGGIIGSLQNIIGAGLEKGSDLASGAGKFILGAASNIPGLGFGLGALQALTEDRFSNLPIGDQLFITEQGDLTDGNKDRYGYNIRSAFGNYGELVRQRAALAAKRGADRQRDIDRYYTQLAAEQAAAEAEAQRRAAIATSQMATANRQSGSGGYQSSFGGDSDFMGGSGTAAEMGSFARGGLATMFIRKR
tara:strand:+ start:726 stop:1829 length:1104 start_codon:yes stop_codon:yes gene_type:complete